MNLTPAARNELARQAGRLAPGPRRAELESHLAESAVAIAVAEGCGDADVVHVRQAVHQLGGAQVSSQFGAIPIHQRRAGRLASVLLGLSLIAGLGSAVLAVRNDVPRLAPWIVVLAAAALAIVILAIIHAWRRTDLEPRQKLLWTVAILLVSPVGAIVYFALGAGLTRDWWRRP